MNKYKTTFKTWNKITALYQDRFMDLDIYNQSYDLFCKLIKKKEARVFKIGCGPGNITKYLLSKRPDFSIKAIDIAPNMIKLARESNPGGDFDIMDCRGFLVLT